MGTISNAVTAQQAKDAGQNKMTVIQAVNSILDGQGMRKRFDELLGARSAQFVSSIVSLVNSDNNMREAFAESPMSVIQAALQAATFDLPISGSMGYAYIVPYKVYKKDRNAYVREATFILGWKGMHQLAIRTGAYKTINVTDIRQGELISYNRLTEEIQVAFIDDDDEREKLPVIGYVGYYKLINGAEKTIYRTVAQIEAHEKKFRKSKDMPSTWKDNFDGMARKTVYRELIGKWGVMSIEYQDRAAAADLADQISEGEIPEADGIVTVNETGEVIENA